MSAVHNDPNHTALLEQAKVRRIGVFVSSKDRALGQPHIRLQHRGMLLAEFYEPHAALIWLTGGKRE